MTAAKFEVIITAEAEVTKAADQADTSTAEKE